MQRELFARTSLDAAYFRRTYQNFSVTDNRAVSASDFDQFSITVPVDPRLPGGGGYTVSGLYDLKPSSFGRPADNLVTRSRNYGKQVERWQGVDVNLNMRPRAGMMLQGGLSTGSTLIDRQLPSPFSGAAATLVVPLAFSLLHEGKENTVERLVRSLEKSAPPREEKPAGKQKLGAKERNRAPIVVDEPTLSQASFDDLITRLPGGRIEGAHLARKTFLHWIYALLAAGVFLALTLVLFPGAGQAVHILAIALFTATIGIVLLVLVQLLAEWTQGRILVSRLFVITLLFWIAWAIGFSYQAAMDPELGLSVIDLGLIREVHFLDRVEGDVPGIIA